LYVTLTMLKLSSTGRLTVFMQKALQRMDGRSNYSNNSHQIALKYV